MTEVIVPLTQVELRPEDMEDLGWQDRALCAQTDPEAFFPEKGGSTREAKRVCRSCEVRAECLEYALESDERFGIWGGLSERERRRITAQPASAQRHQPSFSNHSEWERPTSAAQHVTLGEEKPCFRCHAFCERPSSACQFAGWRLAIQ